MERPLACNHAGVKIHFQIGTSCVSMSCSKCASDGDFYLSAYVLAHDKESSVDYGIENLPECDDNMSCVGEETITNLQLELIDTSIAAVMWSEDESDKA